MKKFFKIIFSIIGILLLCLMIFAQIVKVAFKPSLDKAKQKAELARIIERADRDCPIPAAMGKGAVTGIKLENDYVTYYLTYEPDFANVLSQIGDEQKIREGILMSFLMINARGDNRGDLIMDLLDKFNCGIRIVITESATGKFDFRASPNEIKALREKYQLNPHEALFNFLSICVEAERINLPQKIDDGILLTDFSLEGENLVFNMQVDEVDYSIDGMSSNKDLLKDSILEEGLNDPSSKSLLDICKVSHTGIKYVFTGKQSHKSFDILFSSDEIRQQVLTPPQVNIQ